MQCDLRTLDHQGAGADVPLKPVPVWSSVAWLVIMASMATAYRRRGHKPRRLSIISLHSIELSRRDGLLGTWRQWRHGVHGAGERKVGDPISGRVLLCRAIRRHVREG
jgi:hypothetical protein